MKHIKIYLESLLDDDDIFLGRENDKKVIECWIRDNYTIHGKLTISVDFVVHCSSHVIVKNKSIISLTNGLFRWGEVNNGFYCKSCNNLKSLEGAPEYVYGDFSCSNCTKLKSLKGAPEYVRRDFYCSGCVGLESLEWAPVNVGGNFYCTGCKNLTITDSDRKKYKIVQ